MRKNIKVTVRSLKKGQKISGFTHDNMHRGFVAYVKEVSPVYVTVEKWRIGSGELKKIPAYARFFIELFDEEIKDKYDRAAGEIVQSIQNKLYRDEIGSKELWNAWLSSDPWELAQNCRKYKLTILGHCTDIIPKHTISGDLLDAGVCAKDEDGYIFWCHFRSSDIKRMEKRYNRRQSHKKML